MQIAAEAQFFSFGTNDLTQMTFGFSRDDVGKFLRVYQDTKILEQGSVRRPSTPTASGQLVAMARAEGPQRPGRTSSSASAASTAATRPRSTSSTTVGLDYVSASPYRVPVARLAAAQAALQVKVGD